MKKYLLLSLLLLTIQELSAQERIVRQNIMIERYIYPESMDYSTYDTEKYLKEGTKELQSHVVYVNHYLSNSKKENPFAWEGGKIFKESFCGEDEYFGYTLTLDRTKLNGIGSLEITFYPTPELDFEFYLYWLQQPSCISVYIDKKYNEQTRELKVKVHGYIDDELREYTRINLFLTQDSLKVPGSDIVHNDVMRAKISEQLFGDSLIIEEAYYGSKYSKEYTYTIPKEINGIPCDPNNMSLVAFISDSYGFIDSFIRNSAKVSISKSSSIEMEKTDDLRIYSENGIVHIQGEYDTGSIYTNDGRLVRNLMGINAFSLEKGLYFIKLNRNEESLVRKVVVSI